MGLGRPLSRKRSPQNATARGTRWDSLLAVIPGELEGQVFVLESRQHEQEIGQPVQVPKDLRVRQLTLFIERHDAPLARPKNAAGKVQRRAVRSTSHQSISATSRRRCIVRISIRTKGPHGQPASWLAAQSATSSSSLSTLRRAGTAFGAFMPLRGETSISCRSVAQLKSFRRTE